MQGGLIKGSLIHSDLLFQSFVHSPESGHAIIKVSSSLILIGYMITSDLWRMKGNALVLSSCTHFPPPPRLTPGHLQFLVLDCKFPGAGALQLSNAPWWGWKKGQMQTCKSHNFKTYLTFSQVDIWFLMLLRKVTLENFWRICRVHFQIS